MIDLRVTTLEHIARGDSLDRVMEHLCRAFETNFPHVICSVLSVDRGGMMHPLAAPSLPMTYSAALDNIAIGPNIGSCGTAAYIRAPVEVHDIATDPRWANYKDAVLPAGPSRMLVVAYSGSFRSGSGHFCALFP